MTVSLSLACSHCDRLAPLYNGAVRVEGVDLSCIDLPVEEIFFRMARFQEFDVAEMSLSTYVVSRGRDNPPFVALPVFPSRMFRHSGIYVNAASGIESPADLAGRTVGVAEYQLTANVWIRGILLDEYGLAPTAVRYRTGGLNDPGRIEKVNVDVPDGIEIEPIPADRTLSEMLVTGEIDAAYTPRAPQPYLDGNPAVRRLFADAEGEERGYYARTGIFPIMHVIVLRRDRYERDRWLAQSLVKAFTAAKEAAVQAINESATLPVMLPWLPTQLESTRRLMGEDFWSYGLDGNEKTLSTFLRYSYEQGLAQSLYQPGELFAPEALEEFVI